MDVKEIPAEIPAENSRRIRKAQIVGEEFSGRSILLQSDIHIYIYVYM